MQITCRRVAGDGSIKSVINVSFPAGESRKQRTESCAITLAFTWQFCCWANEFKYAPAVEMFVR